MIDFSKYKDDLSVDAFVSVVFKDIIKELDDDKKVKLKNLSSTRSRKAFTRFDEEMMV